MRFTTNKNVYQSQRKSNLGILLSKNYYQLNNTILQHVDQNPYLGLQFSGDLTWTPHITKNAKKPATIWALLEETYTTAQRPVANQHI